MSNDLLFWKSLKVELGYSSVLYYLKVLPAAIINFVLCVNWL